MTNELTRIENQLPALTPDAEATKIVEAVASFWPDDGTPPVLRRELVSDERKRVTERLRVLNIALRGVSLSVADRERAAKAIALMFAGFPSLRNADASGMVAAYLSFFEALPLFAILRACDAVIRGDIGDSSEFPPTAPSMYRYAEESMASQVIEKTKLEKLLSATPSLEQTQTETQRERIAAKFKKLSDKLHKPMKEEKAEREQRSAEFFSEVNARALESEYRSGKREPMKHVSLALTTLLAKQRKEA